MSKNDGDRDETPIRFSQRGGRVPVPVNQPHWKHNTDFRSRPTFGGWLTIILFDLSMVALIYIVLREINDGSKWVVAIFAGIMIISITLPVAVKYLPQYGQQDENNQDDALSKKAKKKQPKRRKDYR